MFNPDKKMKVLACMLSVLFFFIIVPVSDAQVVLPDVNMEVENAVPFETAMQTAVKKAEALWGKVAPGEAIPCCDDDGDVVAYMVPFAIGKDIFPAYESILDRIRMGRAAFEEVTKELQGMQGDLPHEPSMIPENMETCRGEDRFAPPVEGGEVQELSRIEGEDANEITDTMAARTLAKQIKYGINEYGTIYVSARYDRFPIPLSAHYLSPFFSVGDLAMQKAQEALGTPEVELNRYYFLGRSRGQFFEFSANGQHVLIEAYHLEFKTREEVLVREGKKVIPSQQMQNDMSLAWDEATLFNPGGSKTGGPDADHTVHNPHFVPDIDWCRGCTPTSAAMAMGYWDNYENGATYTGYGRLFDFWCFLHKYSDDTGPIINVPYVVEELRLAMNTDVEGSTWVGDIEPGIEHVCNTINGYNFNSRQYYSNGGSWNFLNITDEIDANRTCVWSVGYIGAIGHSLCAWGYTDSWYVITYSTWGRGRDDWYYKKYDNDIDLDWSYVHTVEPSGSTVSQNIVLDGPDGDEEFIGGEPCTIRWYQFGTLTNDVDIYYSSDSGVTWNLIEGYVPSNPNTWNTYTWNVPNITDFGMRVKIKAFSNTNYYVAGDGSFTDFTIIKTCDLYDDGESYRYFAPLTTVCGLGQPFEAHCDVRNGGGTDSGPFKVKFYASTNTYITPGDHFLGTVNMTNIPSGTYADCDLFCTLPSYVPTGEYWIGWIIDADNEVDESDETNNVAHKGGYQLTVEPSPVPDIKANGQGGSVVVPFGTPVTVTVGLNPNGMDGMMGDVFIYVKRYGDVKYSWIFPAYWIYATTPELSVQFNLQSFSSVPFFSGLLPRGNWEFCFAVDQGDGVYEGTFEDCVEVTVQ